MFNSKIMNKKDEKSYHQKNFNNTKENYEKIMLLKEFNLYSSHAKKLKQRININIKKNEEFYKVLECLSNFFF